MNERIGQLAEQAGLLGPSSRIGNAHEATERFAELIVRECIEQLGKEGDDWEQFSRNPPEGQETNAGPALFAAYRLKEDAVSRLEEHFGVK